MSRPNSISLPALLAVLVLAITACGTGAASPSATDSAAPPATASPSAGESAEASASEAAGEEVAVSIVSSVYDPGELTIPAGTTVAFTNDDTFAHTVTEGTGGQAVESPFVDSEVAAGETVEVTFDEPGTYEITCTFHPSMQMTVVVEG